VPGRPGRYQRTTSGLLASLLATVLAVVGFVGFRALNRDDLEVRPEKVDYLATVEALQLDGSRPVYPAELPDGWLPTSVDVVPGTVALSWGIGILTDDDLFVGVRQSSQSLPDLLETYVDERAEEGDPVTIASPLATTWRSFSDAGGDHAYAAEVGDQWVLVFGSASEADLQAVVASLTTDPVAG
jgi:hypothetical protein